MFFFGNEDEEVEKPYFDFFQFINKTKPVEQNFSISVQPDDDLKNEDAKEEVSKESEHNEDEGSASIEFNWWNLLFVKA